MVKTKWQIIEEVADERYLSAVYWRERLLELQVNFEGYGDLAKKIFLLDDLFHRPDAHTFVRMAWDGKASADVTRAAVRAAEKYLATAVETQPQPVA